MLKVHGSSRYLCHEDGRPFFYLADTAWEFIHRLNPEEMDVYLRDRAARGFTAIQAVVLFELDEAPTDNIYGEKPLIDWDPSRLNDRYFDIVDYAVKRINEFGMVVALLPTWGDKWNNRWGAGPEIFTTENARIYGEILGSRYADSGLIWVLGGDRPVETGRHLKIIRAMAEGIAAGDGGRHLRTFHPCGGRSSAEFVHAEPWLDFNMAQSGHTGHVGNYRHIWLDRARVPVKPCLDGEPCYEDHPVMKTFWPETTGDWFGAYDVRRAAYWAVLGGACGHTYGSHPVWQMYDDGRKPVNRVRMTWREALNLPGADQMRHVRALVESRPYFERFPDDTLVAEGPRAELDHVSAARDGTPGRADASFMMVYFPGSGRPPLNTTVIPAERLQAWWFDPRTGKAMDAGLLTPSVRMETPASPTEEDWVLILDDPARNYPPSGQAC